MTTYGCIQPITKSCLTLCTIFNNFSMFWFCWLQTFAVLASSVFYWSSSLACCISYSEGFFSVCVTRYLMFEKLFWYLMIVNFVCSDIALGFLLPFLDVLLFWGQGFWAGHVFSFFNSNGVICVRCYLLFIQLKVVFQTTNPVAKWCLLSSVVTI